MYRYDEFDAAFVKARAAEFRDQGAEVSILGDFCETLVFTNSPAEVQRYLEATVTYDEIVWAAGQKTFLEIKSQEFPPDHVLEALAAMDDVVCVKKLNSVLPIKSRKNLRVPFITCEEMLAYNEGRDLALWELAVHYEAARGRLSHDEVVSKMTEIVRIMGASVTQGLKGTEYLDRILPCQSVGFKEKMDQKALIHGDVLNKIIMSVTAIMEVKSSMGVIVAAPTAGSCGALPGTVLGTASALGLSEEDTVKAMLAAGMIGVFVCAHASFAAEVGGCQAECGSGAGMAAAALVGMAGGNLPQSLSAASIALQNSFGMVCDPIANRVEAPCLGKNIMAASNALSCANMALANYNHLIPLDEVIEAMDKVGKSIPNDLRCTALGGLSVTKTSKEIEARLQEQGAAPAFRFKIC